ncbi:TadE/TadG family type IV pilus assembly protein [Actinacidiphila rubida]|uniref:Putative Flp pilus-assembly TadE/G-like n=1 Tax=Actinacidiphila rubida TaxID=310780 RepID=A0A1H8DKY5_9ACTN|nr:Tad domain-containing protein [Actinacidiphila rubida]SEN07815.1 Putative Flp pilus-assembly TadE/G-like [Actinacidiphila rubida]
MSDTAVTTRNPSPSPSRCRALAHFGRRVRARLRDDRGSGAAAVLIFALVFMSLAAFVVDGGLSISKRERAADIAEQAARYAAQDIDVEALRNAPAGTQPVINDGDCDMRVQWFAKNSGLDQADVDATHCTPNTGPQRVEVIVQITYRPMLSGFFYDHDIVVHGTAAAESVTGPAN